MCLLVDGKETQRLLDKDWEVMTVLKGVNINGKTPYRKKKIKKGWLKARRSIFSIFDRSNKREDCALIHDGAIHVFPGSFNKERSYSLIDIWCYLECKAYKEDFIASGSFQGMASLCFKKIWIPEEEIDALSKKLASDNPEGYF